MRIDRITVWALDLPLRKPYALSGGRLQFRALDSTIVRIDSDAGAAGWGESCPWGATYLPAHGRGARAAIAEIAPALLGRDPRGLDAINRAMDEALPGHLYAKSALDMACWDLLGHAAGLPLVTLLGGREAASVPLHSSIPTGTPEAMVADIRAARQKGYRTHSAKIGLGYDTDLDIIDAIRADRGHDETITYDVNRAWLPATAIRIMNRAGDDGLWFEQPCETLAECAHVSARTRQAIILDECIHTLDDLARMRALGAGEAIGLKVGRVGGLTKARRMRDFCTGFGIAMNLEETGGTILADTAAVHLAAATPPASHRATWLCHEMLTVDIAPGQGARNAGGMAGVGDTPGIGVQPDPGVLGDPVAVYE